MYFTIDRIVGTTVVLLDDNDQTYKLDTSAIGFAVAEGELLCGDVSEAGVVITAKDPAELERRMEERRARRRARRG